MGFTQGSALSGGRSRLYGVLFRYANGLSARRPFVGEKGVATPEGAVILSPENVEAESCNDQFEYRPGSIGCDTGHDQTAQRLMSLLKNGKHLSVQEMLSKEMRSMATMLGGVSNETLNSYYRSDALASYQLSLMEETDRSVRYKVTVTTRDGKTHSDFIDLVEEAGEWRVSRF